MKGCKLTLYKSVMIFIVDSCSLSVSFNCCIYCSYLWYIRCQWPPDCPASGRWEFSRGKKRFEPSLHRNIFEMNFISFKSPFLSLHMLFCVHTGILVSGDFYAICMHVRNMTLQFMWVIIKLNRCAFFANKSVNMHSYLHSHICMLYICTLLQD